MLTTAIQTRGGTLSRLIEEFKIRRQRSAVYWQTLNELRSLTARELDDIGVLPTDIPRIAHEAAYGR